MIIDNSFKLEIIPGLASDSVDSVRVKLMVVEMNDDIKSGCGGDDFGSD